MSSEQRYVKATNNNKFDRCPPGFDYRHRKYPELFSAQLCPYEFWEPVHRKATAVHAPTADLIPRPSVLLEKDGAGKR